MTTIKYNYPNKNIRLTKYPIDWWVLHKGRIGKICINYLNNTSWVQFGPDGPFERIGVKYLHSATLEQACAMEGISPRGLRARVSKKTKEKSW